MIDIEVKGLEEKRIAVTTFERTLKHGYAAWFSGVFSGEMTKYFVQRFDSEGATHGERWKPLTQRTLAQTRHIRRGGILYRFGRMRQAFISPSAPGSLETIEAFQYQRGAKVGYAIHHQEGTRFLPKRAIIVVPPQLAVFWLALLKTYHDAELKKAGLEPE